MKEIGDKLNIAVMGSVTLPIPPFKGYGGTQRGVYDFLTHLNEKGHRLHLFGPGDSKISHLGNVVLHSFIEQSLWIPENTLSIEEKRIKAKEHYNLSLEVLEQVDQEEGIDIINIRKDNLDFIKEVVESFGPERVVYSLHNVKDQARMDTIRDLGIRCVAHCRNHREQHGNLNNVNVIMYGINVREYPFSEETLAITQEIPTLDVLKVLQRRGKDYLITLGGVGPHKGQRTCIELAKAADMPLIIAGTPQSWSSNRNQLYFEEEVEPSLDGENIIYFGNADEEQKKELLMFSKGFLFPSGYEDKTWNEPFGRAPVEALACGTPVIAYRKGSMEEVVFDSFNGYLFDSSAEAVRQIGDLGKIDRTNCRRTAERKFNSIRVADEYETLFYSKFTQD